MQMTKASGRMRLDAVADRVHHLQIDAEQVVAAHAGLARHAGGDDDDVGAGDVGVGARARELGVEALDRPGFGEIERLALRHAVDDVEQDDVAQFLQRGQMRQRAADLAGPDQSNLLARHGEFFRSLRQPHVTAAQPREVRGLLSADRPRRSSRTFGSVEANSRGGVNGASDSAAITTS